MTADQIRNELNILNANGPRMSNFIDQKLLDDCLPPVKPVDRVAQKKNKKPLEEFIVNLEKDLIIPEIGNKIRKIEQNGKSAS